MELASPLQYDKNMWEHIPSNAREILLLLQHAMIAPLLVLLIASIIHFATQHQL